jgi:nucleoside-diphosphate-sugar epimerase
MGYRIFLAGASGAVGRRLTPLLRDAGHSVYGTTRSEAKAEALRNLGASPVVVDVFDAAALSRIVTSVRPEIVIHQLTDLPKDLDPSQMGDAIVRNARIRDEGTRNLVRAAVGAGAHRLVAQSIAWAYAPGPEPHVETDPFDVDAQGERGVTVRGVIALENLTLKSPPLEGVVLRYGQLYGPGTHSAQPSNSTPIHVDAAAYAALLAIDHGEPGIYNIAQPNRHVATEKARAVLGWTADFRQQGSVSDRPPPSGPQ